MTSLTPTKLAQIINRLENQERLNYEDNRFDIRSLHSTELTTSDKADILKWLAYRAFEVDRLSEPACLGHCVRYIEGQVSIGEAVSVSLSNACKIFKIDQVDMMNLYYARQRETFVKGMKK